MELVRSVGSLCCFRHLPLYKILILHGLNVMMCSMRLNEKLQMMLHTGEKKKKSMTFGLWLCCCILLQETVSQVTVVLPGLEPAVPGMRARISADEDSDS